MPTPADFIRSIVLLSATVALLTIAPTASAQSYDIIVLPGEVWEVDDWEDVVEESAYLTEDFGGYRVSRWYQLQNYVDRGTEIQVSECARDVRCYVDALFGVGLDYALVVNLVREDAEIVVRYQTIDLALGSMQAEEFAFLPSSDAFEFLLAPCHEALKVTPEWTTPVPVPQVVVAPPPPPSVVVQPVEPRRQMSPFERIGTATAGTGAALFGGGVLLGFAADETQQTIQAEPHARRELESLQARGQRQQRMANALMIIGGTALAGGAGILIYERISRDDDVALSIETDLTSVRLRATF